MTHTGRLKMDISFNLNDTVKVQLTDFGQRVLAKDYQKYGLPMLREVPQDSLDGKFQLYDLMHIFGPVTYFPAQQMPFLNNIISFELPEHIAEAIEYHAYCKSLERNEFDFSSFSPKEYAEHRKNVRATGVPID